MPSRVAAIAVLLLTLHAWVGSVPALAREAPAAAAVVKPVKLNSLRGRWRLWRCSAKQPYRSLARAFEYQTRSMCGPTSLANVLNALERTARHSQFSVLRSSGRSLAQVRGEAPPRKGVTPPRGFNLDELAGVLRRYPVAVETRVVSPRSPVGRVKAELAGALAGRGHVVVNFDRGALGQPGRGHFSPLGAYDARSDAFLVLDVNRERGWSWIDADALIAAMGRRTPQSRGYLVVSGEPRP